MVMRLEHGKRYLYHGKPVEYMGGSNSFASVYFVEQGTKGWVRKTELREDHRAVSTPVEPEPVNQAPPVGAAQVNVLAHVCPECDRRFLYEHGLKTHLAMKHGVRGTSPTAQRSHQAAANGEDSRPERVRCQYCNRRFQTKKGLGQHCRKTHNILGVHAKNNLRNAQEPNFTCPECGRTFATSRGRGRHWSVIHGTPGEQGGYARFAREIAQAAAPEQTTQEAWKVYECAGCGHSFTACAEYHRHMRQAHTPQEPASSTNGEQFGVVEMLRKELSEYQQIRDQAIEMCQSLETAISVLDRGKKS